MDNPWASPWEDSTRPNPPHSTPKDVDVAVGPEPDEADITSRTTAAAASWDGPIAASWSAQPTAEGVGQGWTDSEQPTAKQLDWEGVNAAPWGTGSEDVAVGEAMFNGGADPDDQAEEGSASKTPSVRTETPTPTADDMVEQQSEVATFNDDEAAVYALSEASASPVASEVLGQEVAPELGAELTAIASASTPVFPSSVDNFGSFESGAAWVGGFNDTRTDGNDWQARREEPGDLEPGWGAVTSEEASGGQIVPEVRKEEWEIAAEDQAKRAQLIPRALVDKLLTNWEEIAIDIFPTVEDEQQHSRGTPLEEVYFLSELLTNLLPQYNLPLPKQFRTTSTASQQHNALKLTKSSPLAQSSPFSHLFTFKSSDTQLWESTVRSHRTIDPEELDQWLINAKKEGREVLGKSNAYPSPELPVKDEDKRGWSFWKNSPAVTRQASAAEDTASIQSKEMPVASPRMSVDLQPVRRSTDKASTGTSILVPAQQLTTSIAGPPADAQQRQKDFFEDELVTSTEQENKPAPSVVSRFLSRFSRKQHSMDGTSSQRNSVALSTDDLQYLSDVPTSLIDDDSSESIMNLENMLKSASPATLHSGKLPPLLSPPPVGLQRPPSTTPEQLVMKNPVDDDLFGVFENTARSVSQTTPNQPLVSQFAKPARSAMSPPLLPGPALDAAFNTRIGPLTTTSFDAALSNLFDDSPIVTSSSTIATLSAPIIPSSGPHSRTTTPVDTINFKGDGSMPLSSGTVTSLVRQKQEDKFGNAPSSGVSVQVANKASTEAGDFDDFDDFVSGASFPSPAKFVPPPARGASTSRLQPPLALALTPLPSNALPDVQADAVRNEPNNFLSVLPPSKPFLRTPPIAAMNESQAFNLFGDAIPPTPPSKTTLVKKPPLTTDFGASYSTTESPSQARARADTNRRMQSLPLPPPPTPSTTTNPPLVSSPVTPAIKGPSQSTRPTLSAPLLPPPPGGVRRNNSLLEFDYPADPHSQRPSSSLSSTTVSPTSSADGSQFDALSAQNKTPISKPSSPLSRLTRPSTNFLTPQAPAQPVTAKTQTGGLSSQDLSFFEGL